MFRKILLLVLPLTLLCACSPKPQASPSITPGATVEQSAVTPPPTAAPDLSQAIPEKLRNGDKVPTLKVYDVKSQSIKDMDIETYLMGVLAGEMKSDWPVEALKAQAIIARTFVLRFVADKVSKYDGADISTDIEEAQAYDETGINDRITQAVKDTAGMVILYDGQPILAWFSAHAGGQTATAAEGLNYTESETPYIVSVPSPDSEKAPDDAKSWSASFSQSEFATAAAKQGVQLGEIKNASVAEWGPSGRAIKISVGGQMLNTADLRIALGSEKLRSTLLTNLSVSNGKIVFEGKGFGHGVGMSQWGAYGMADEGSTATEIIRYYFQDVSIETLWKSGE